MDCACSKGTLPCARGCTASPSISVSTGAIASLPPRQRAAVVLRLFHDLAYAEIASVMGCAEGTVKGTMSAAFGKLRTRLCGLLPTRPAGDQRS
ncbi:MAG: RNA polymerase sigma factor [Armatimonadetes bacterium]|nr:RNA polymerase sigma factor [Armatimonadota bacterium]